MKKLKLLNIHIQLTTKDELLRDLVEGVLLTPNLDHMVKLQKDKELYDIYQNAEWVVCDSKIIYLCSKLLAQQIPEAIPGSSFFSSYYRYHENNEECRIFLLGAAEGIASLAMENINLKVGRNIVVGSHSPSFGFEKDIEECRSIVDLINSSGATVLVVGVGAPKQEKWISTHKRNMPGVKLFMGLGATIDFEAGTLKRAPRIYQSLYLEWLYRFMVDPKRLFKRYFIEDPVFFYYLFKQFIGVYVDPFKNSKS